MSSDDGQVAVEKIVGVTWARYSRFEYCLISQSISTREWLRRVFY